MHISNKIYTFNIKKHLRVILFLIGFISLLFETNISTSFSSDLFPNSRKYRQTFTGIVLSLVYLNYIFAQF